MDDLRLMIVGEVQPPFRMLPADDTEPVRPAHAVQAARNAESSPRALGEPRTIRIVGSHDFTLDLLASALHAQDPSLTLAVESVGSLSGLLALQQHTAHVAPAHLLDEETGDFNRGYIQHLLAPLGVRVVLLGFVEREQGLIVRKGNPKAIQVLADLVRPDVTLVNRQRGAGTRVLLDYHLRRAGLPAQQVRGYEQQEPTHLAVAAAVADGRADCGLGVPAAARALDLDFLPLFHERFDLVIPVEHYASALLAPLLALLRRPQAGFVQKVAALGGYATGVMGKVLAEM
jgi:putative molybdopterin biosynthesis protein